MNRWERKLNTSRRWPAVMLAGTLAVSACGNEVAPPQPTAQVEQTDAEPEPAKPEQPTPMPTPSTDRPTTTLGVPLAECSTDDVADRIYLNPERSNQLTKELEMMSVLYSDQPRVRDINLLALFGVRSNVQNDPSLAHAMYQARNDLLDGRDVTVDDLFSYQLPEMTFCEEGFILTKNDQLEHQVAATVVAEDIKNRYFELLNSRGKTFAQPVIDSFKETQKFVDQTYQNWLEDNPEVRKRVDELLGTSS